MAEESGPVQVHKYGLTVTWPMVATLAGGLALGGYSAGQQIERMNASIGTLQATVAGTPTRLDLARVQAGVSVLTASLRSFTVRCPSFPTRGRSDMECTALVEAGAIP